jgi:hypothetical protein
LKQKDKVPNKISHSQKVVDLISWDKKFQNGGFGTAAMTEVVARHGNKMELRGSACGVASAITGEESQIFGRRQNGGGE